MFSIMKNMMRRKGRTILTVSGIAIGVFAFTVMGAMAEKITLLVNGGTRYYSDKVTVQAAGGSFSSFGTGMSISKLPELERVPGVKAASAVAMTTLSDPAGAVSLGPPAMVIGTDFTAQKYETFPISFSAGRDLQEGDTRAALVGADLVKKLHAKVGGDIKVKGENFRVVGILNKTLTAPDNEVMVTLADAQRLYHTSLPAIVKSQTKASEIVNGFTVFPEAGVDPNELAGRINHEVKDVSASGPKAFQEQIAAATGIFNAILFGIAFISLLVGGLSVINTMTMSITERIREIGVKKAVGAKTRNIMAEYLSEAGLIGLLGGLIGWGIGALTVLVINQASTQSGNMVFLLTVRLSVFAVAFAAVLGVVAGIYPAYHAVRVNIVQALREG